MCAEMTLSFQENQWTLFGCETSWSLSWISTLQHLGDEPGMSKEVGILNIKLSWRDGVGISCETDQKHAEELSSAEQEHPI